MSICDSIKKKYIRLSKGQRKVAQFVIDNPNIIATQVASEVGRQAGVSESTVIRFCYAMDLSGFSELQQKVKEYLIEKDGAAPVTTKARAIKKQNIPCNEVMSRDIDSIVNTMQRMHEQNFNETIDLLHNANRIFILGVRSSAPAALWLYNNLASYRNNVQLMSYNTEKIAIDLTQMNEHSVLFVVGVNEQQDDVMAVVELAKRKKVKLVAITDNVPCPLQKQADLLLTTGTSEHNVMSCDIAVFSLLHSIVECMIMQYKEYYTSARTQSTHNIPNSLIEWV
ncbi:MurR/RpiR family transcriptional regulator [Lysinibacillus sp. LZ02]|uniref:MurR/RpiR family transcriptional regulator n=1 Tax=Lysinibacillus sp. LZ02 TaxID=3420668 RepID=UPI003D361D8E